MANLKVVEDQTNFYKSDISGRMLSTLVTVGACQKYVQLY